MTLLPFIFFEEGYPTPLLGFVQSLYAIVVVLLCFPLSDVLTRLTERLRGIKKKQPKMLSNSDRTPFIAAEPTPLVSIS